MIQRAGELQAAVASFRDRNARLERELTVAKLARKYSLPDDLAACLTGDTLEALESHAKALRKYAAQAEPVILRGGLDPADDGDGFDPVRAAREARTSRY